MLHVFGTTLVEYLKEKNDGFHSLEQKIKRLFYLNTLGRHFHVNGKLFIIYTVSCLGILRFTFCI